MKRFNNSFFIKHEIDNPVLSKVR